MFDRVKSFAKRMGNKLKYGAAIVSAAIGTAIMTVVASADDSTSTASTLETAVTNAGAQLQSEFSTLVTTISPVLIGIAVTGLGIYAVIFLFRMAKRLFSAASH